MNKYPMNPLHRTQIQSERQTSLYQWQLGDWEALKKQDKAKPAYDPSRIPADETCVGIKRDGSLKKFTAVTNYLNWPCQRATARDDAGNRSLSVDDTDSPEYWESLLDADGLSDLDAMPSYEFNEQPELVIGEQIDRSIGSSMTGQVCRNLEQFSKGQSMQAQYEIWLNACKAAKYANEVSELVKCTTKGTTRGKGQRRGKNKFEELRLAAKLAREAACK